MRVYKTDALTDPKDILNSTETTDGVPQSEKTIFLFLHSKGATPNNAHPNIDGMILNFKYDFFCALVPMKQEHHNEETGTGRDEATSTQGAEATGIHTKSIAMIFY